MPTTPRDRLLTALAGREADRVPLHFVCGDPALRALIEAAEADPRVRRRFLIGDVDTVTFAAREDLSVFARYHRDTPADDVDAEVAERMATVAAGGGYVVNFINVAWSPRSRPNVLRYLQAVQERGVY